MVNFIDSTCSLHDSAFIIIIIIFTEIFFP